MGSASPLLVVDELVTEFRTEAGAVRAVNGTSFEVGRGETVGVVGESGCGKSVTALSIMRLIQGPSGRIAAGRVLFEGKDLAHLAELELRRVRGNHIAMIFQEPMTSLNPVLTAGEQVAEVLRLHQKLGRAAARARTIELFAQVGIPEPASRYEAYPHQLSGGMRQRVMIAMAIACGPRLLIADEPTTALDVTIQAQILELLARLQRELGMAILFITHDLGVVAETCKSVVVMYAGKVVERGPTLEVLDRPRHHYTAGLIAARIPDDAEPRARLAVIPERKAGRVPVGCPFADRCLRAEEVCWQTLPELTGEGHQVRCHFPLPEAS